MHELRGVHGDMPGDKIEIGDSHKQKAAAVFPVLVGKLKANFEPQIRDRIWLTEGRGYLLYDDNTLEPEPGRGSNTIENFAQNGLLRLFDAQVNGQTYTYQQIISGEYPRNQYYQPGNVLKKAVVKRDSGGEYSLVHPGRIEMKP